MLKTVYHKSAALESAVRKEKQRVHFAYASGAQITSAHSTGIAFRRPSSEHST